MKRGLSPKGGVIKARVGFTLTEVLVTIVILGILASIATPMFGLTIERSRASEARANLEVIHMGQKIYQLDNGTFYGPQATLATINANLNTEITTDNYTLNITAAAAATYTATASRGNGGAKVFTINETGVIAEAGTYDP